MKEKIECITGGESMDKGANQRPAQICKLYGHKPGKYYHLEYPPLCDDPPIGKLYCERCGKLLYEVG